MRRKKRKLQKYGNEIKFKFRAIKDSSPLYVYGNLLYDGETPMIQENDNIFLFTICAKGTEAMFTGILDKHGNEIYSDDTLYDEETSLMSIQDEARPAGYRWEEPVEFVEGCFTVAMYPLADCRMDMEICLKDVKN